METESLGAANDVLYLSLRRVMKAKENIYNTCTLFCLYDYINTSWQKSYPDVTKKKKKKKKRRLDWNIIKLFDPSHSAM
jgi:hypothetical protein